jgi:hypothetical protein
MELKRLVRAAIFTALAVGVGFSLVLVPNVELITVVIFLSGLTLGPGWGMLVGGTAEFVFSALNPLGSGLIFPPLFVAQVLSMVIVGAVGGLLRPFFFVRSFPPVRVGSLALVGFLLTFLYDSLTTLSYPVAAGFEGPQTLGIYLSGLGFTLVHQVFNGLIFALGVPPVVKQLA